MLYVPVGSRDQDGEGILVVEVVETAGLDVHCRGVWRVWRWEVVAEFAQSFGTPKSFCGQGNWARESARRFQGLFRSDEHSTTTAQLFIYLHSCSIRQDDGGTVRLINLPRREERRLLDPWGNRTTSGRH